MGKIISLHPGGVQRYLKKGIRAPFSDIHYGFFLSFEDALWRLLDIKKVKKGSTILLPNFYCGDVIDQIHNHGYKTAVYPLNKNLQVENDQFLSIVKECNPSVIFFLHANGIQCEFTTDKRWIANISYTGLIIEDFAHRIITRDEINPINDNYFYIDSLRKSLPFCGSHIFGDRSTIREMQRTSDTRTLYRLYHGWMYRLARLLLRFSFKSNSRFLYFIADKVFDIHENTIGHSKYGNAGFLSDDKGFNRLDIEKIETHKRNLSKEYIRILQKVSLDEKAFEKFAVSDEDLGKLRAFPIMVDVTCADEVLKHLEKQGIFTWYNLPEGSWSREKRLLLLPLHLPITLKDVARIVDVLCSFRVEENTKE